MFNIIAFAKSKDGSMKTNRSVSNKSKYVAAAGAQETFNEVSKDGKLH